MTRHLGAMVSGICLRSAGAALAKEQKLFVAMPTDRRHARLNEADASLVEEAVRRAAGNALSPPGYTVATQDTAMQLLRILSARVEIGAST